MDIYPHALVHRVAFVGDSLFAMGCGRLFEGTYDQMFASLQKLRALPDDTRVRARSYTRMYVKYVCVGHVSVSTYVHTRLLCAPYIGSSSVDHQHIYSKTNRWQHIRSRTRHKDGRAGHA